MKHPLFPYVLLLALGIILADAWPALSPWLMTAVGAGLMVGAIALQWKRKCRWQQWTFGVLAALAVVCLGYARMGVVRPVSMLGSERQCYEMTIVTTPERTAHAWRAMAKVQGERVMLYFDEPPRKGDRLLAYCQMREPAPADNPHQFDYKRYLMRKGICHTAFLHKDDYITLEEGGGVLLRLRERVYGTLQDSPLTPQQRGIAEALVLGYDSDVDPETQRLFRNAGIMHLLCVSGLHVGIVATLLASLLFWVVPFGRWYRHAKGAAQVLGIWFFALFTGLAPSTVRASVMFTFVVAGRLTFRLNGSLNNLAAAALCILMAQPGQLFDIGFQLSFSTVLGIVLFLPKLVALWHPRWKLLRTVWHLTCLSVTAQMACAPLILFYFHQFPPYFLIANLLIVPLAGVILGSCLLLVLTAVWPWLFGLMAKVVGWELMATDWVTRMVSSLPAALVENICFPAPLLWLCVAIIVLLALERYWGSLVLALCLAIGAIGLSWHHGQQESLIIYATPRVTALEHVQGHRSTLYLSDSVDIAYQRQGYAIARGIRHTDTFYGEHLIHYQDKVVYCVDRANLPLLCDPFPIHVDYLVVSQTPWMTPPELRHVVDYDTLVIAADNSPYRTPLWHGLCRRDSIPCHDMARSGAKVLN